MPDSFFTSSKPRKRKRADSNNRATTAGTTNKFTRNGPPTRNGRTSGSAKLNGVQKKKSRAVDEELSDQTDSGDGGIDDLDLRDDADMDPGASGEEDEDETPAEKRLRLAKLYLEGVKEGLGEFLLALLYYNVHPSQILADGEFDAAEIDRELISARLKQDVMEHSGKVHSFIADSVGS
jgi:ribosomal RNA-processing protein 9